MNQTERQLGPRMLVTGAGGFVGRALVTALAARGIEPATPRQNALGRSCDLLDAADRHALIDAERPEILVHLAWVTEHGAFWESPLNAVWETASRDLFAAFYAAGGRRVVGLGTCAEYDWRSAAAPLPETAPVRPHTSYGAAKARTADALVDLAARAGASAAWGRVFHLFGYGEPPRRLVPSMIAAALGGVPLPIGPGDTARDLWDVRNLGAALAALALSEVQGAINLAGGQSVRFDRLAALVGALGGHAGAIRCGGRSLAPGEPHTLVADTTRLNDALGFTAPVTLERGLADYVAAMRRPITGV